MRRGAKGRMRGPEENPALRERRHRQDYQSYRPLRDGTCFVTTRHFVPGYLHLVPTGPQSVNICPKPHQYVSHPYIPIYADTKSPRPFRGRGRERGNPRLLLSGSLFRDRLLFYNRLIDPFDVGHRRGVAITRSELDDANIAALSRSSSRSHIRKEPAHCFLLSQESESQPAGVQIIAFPQGNHSLGKRPHRLGFSESRPDTAMLDEAADLVG